MPSDPNHHRSSKNVVVIDASKSKAFGGTRLSAYAAAASSAVLAGAAGSSAEAAVVIVNITPEAASSDFTIRLDAAGLGGSYTFFNNDFAGGFYPLILKSYQATNNQQYVAAQLVGTGVFLDSNDAWITVSTARAFPAAGQTVYLGFRLTVTGGNSRYGWIEYVNDGTSTTVSRWAYESVVNTGITTPTASAVPGGAGLAALVCGAAGVRGRRRSRG